MSLKFKLTPTKSLLRCLLDSVECIPPPRPKSCLLYSFIDTSHPIMIQIHALLPEISRKCWKTPCDVKFRENPFSSSRVILLTNQQTKHPLAEIFTLRESPPFHPYMCHFRVVSLPNTLAFCVHSFTRYKPTIPSEPGQRYAGIKCWIEKKNLSKAARNTNKPRGNTYMAEHMMCCTPQSASRFSIASERMFLLCTGHEKQQENKQRHMWSEWMGWNQDRM